jgi:hypothetical protein
MADLQNKMGKLVTLDQHQNAITQLSQNVAPLATIQTDLYGADLKGTTSGIKFQLNQILTKLMAPVAQVAQVAQVAAAPSGAVPVVQQMRPSSAAVAPVLVAPVKK